MHVLTDEDLELAENSLRELFPESLKVYGYLFNINRRKPHNMVVISDAWPDFNVIICKQKQQHSQDREGDFNIYSIYSRDRESLQKLLSSNGVIDWSTFTLLGGVDINHIDVVKELCAYHNIPSKTEGIMFVLMLEDLSHLKEPESTKGYQIGPLSVEHADLVNSTWKYGGNQNSYNSVRNYISNYPSWGVMDGSGRPVSWVLLYHHSALGLLYTLPEHRCKGYAKMLISIMAKQLYEMGYPVYCFVEEDNEVSYRLFTSLGFRHKPDYRAVWFQLNERVD
uniref:Glycine N-acyltransferase-like protein n=1 Tax=Paramormyrops kingsleyae TaxID=1676925 RepID=A0A3B3RLU1_9TELE